MKREDIKQEAQNMCDKRFSYLHNSAFFDGFVTAAEWRINSVWHNADEVPKEKGYILVEVNGSQPTVSYTHLTLPTTSRV